jgi:hypothetical protein
MVFVGVKNRASNEEHKIDEPVIEYDENKYDEYETSLLHRLRETPPDSDFTNITDIGEIETYKNTCESLLYINEVHLKKAKGNNNEIVRLNNEEKILNVFLKEIINQIDNLTPDQVGPQRSPSPQPLPPPLPARMRPPVRRSRSPPRRSRSPPGHRSRSPPRRRRSGNSGSPTFGSPTRRNNNGARGGKKNRTKRKQAKRKHTKRR